MFFDFLENNTDTAAIGQTGAKAGDGAKPVRQKCKVCFALELPDRHNKTTCPQKKK